MARGLKAHYPGVGHSIQVQTDEIADAAITSAKLAAGVGGIGGTLVRSVTSTAVANNQDACVSGGLFTYREGGTTYTALRTSDASATPGAATIPIADGAGQLDAGWGGAASTLATLDAAVEVVEPARKLSTTALGADQDVQIVDSGVSFQDGTSAQYTLRPQMAIGPIHCTPPDVDNAAMALNLEAYAPRDAFFVTGVTLRVGTLPAAGDSFQFNLVKETGAGLVTDLFGADQTYASTSTVSSCRKTVDAGANYTDYTTEANGAGTVDIAALDTALNGDWLVVAYTGKFESIIVDMDGANVNANASVLTVEYYGANGGGAGVPGWAAVPSFTDGTINAGATFGKDGTISFTQPVDWIQNTVDGVTDYHIRLSVSAALSAGTAIAGITLTRIAGEPAEYVLASPEAIASGDSLHMVTREIDATADNITVVVKADFA